MVTKIKDSAGDEAANRHATAGGLSPQARRALEEAEARRAAQTETAGTAGPAKREIGGCDGPEPIRYGDWEINGRTSDF